MKKLLLSFATIAMMAAPALADQVAVTWASEGYSNATDVTTVEKTPVTFTFDKGTGSNAPKYYTSGNAVRTYANNTLTISVADGYKLTGIDFTFESSNYSIKSTNSTISTGTMDYNNNAWTPSNDVSTVTIKVTTGQIRYVSTTVYYESTNPDAVVAPTLTMVEGNYGYVVEMTAAEGASIYYTMHDAWSEGEISDPTTASTLYTGPVEVWGDTDFRAIAVVNGVSSGITYFTANPPMVMSDFINLPMDDVPTDGYYVEFRPESVGGGYVAVYQGGQYLYVYDPSSYSYMLFYGNAPEYAPGTKFSKIIGTYVLYNGLPEVKNYTATVDTSSTASVPEPMQYDIDEVMPNILNKYILLNNVKIQEEGSSFYAVDEFNNGLVLYNRFGLDIEPAESANITGFVSIYGETLQLFPTQIIINQSQGISGINADNAPAEYFNLNGVRVANPENGMYIMRQGGKVSKVIVK